MAKKTATDQQGTTPWCACCQVSKAGENRSHLLTPSIGGGGQSISWMIASGTLLQKNHGFQGKLCDFIIFSEPSQGQIKNILAEMKSKSTRASAVHEQFQGGARLLVGSNHPIVPVLIHNGIDSMEVRILSRIRIAHNGKKYPIKIERSPKDASEL